MHSNNKHIQIKIYIKLIFKRFWIICSQYCTLLKLCLDQWKHRKNHCFKCLTFGRYAMINNCSCLPLKYRKVNVRPFLIRFWWKEEKTNRRVGNKKRHFGKREQEIEREWGQREGEAWRSGRNKERKGEEDRNVKFSRVTDVGIKEFYLILLQTFSRCRNFRTKWLITFGKHKPKHFTHEMLAAVQKKSHYPGFSYTSVMTSSLGHKSNK